MPATQKFNCTFWVNEIDPFAVYKADIKVRQAVGSWIYRRNIFTSALCRLIGMSGWVNYTEAFSAFFIFAHSSLRVTVLLNTGFLSVESFESKQK